MYKIILDRSVIDRFRETVNEMPWLIYEDDEDKKHWNTICACMERITDIVDYLNNKELGDEQYRSNAFDFIDFIAQSSVLVDSVVRLSKIINGDSYDIRTSIPHDVIFKSKKFAPKFKLSESQECYDYKYYEYLRSICAVHPALTNRHKAFQTSDAGEASPFVLWSKMFGGLRDDGAELHAHIYINGELKGTNALPIYINEVFDYIKWNYLNLDYLSYQLMDKNMKKIEVFRETKLPSRNDCVDYKDYMQRLMGESRKRFPNFECLFESSGHIVGIDVTDRRNLQKYKAFEKKIMEATEDARGKLQEMNLEVLREGDILLEKLLFPDIDENDSMQSASYFYSKACHLISPNGGMDVARWGVSMLQPFLSKYINLTKDDCELLDRYELYALIHVALDLYWTGKG